MLARTFTVVADANLHETGELGDPGSLAVEEQRFAVVPEWIIDADISDGAFRAYALLLRYGNTSGCRMPSRALLARRLHRSVDSVDRAMRELGAAGIVQVEHRHDGRQNLTNRYYVRTSRPLPRTASSEGGRNSAATPGRRSAARVAADLRPNPEVLTDKPPPPTPSERLSGGRLEEEGLLRECGIHNLQDVAERCAAARRSVGRSVTRWSAICLVPAVRLSVRHRGWPAELVERALLTIAADPSTSSPMRLAEAGPWWDDPPDKPHDGDELKRLEARLDSLDGDRVPLQAAARAELLEDGLPLTRGTVLHRACEILDRGASA